jgi:hypothetical protein
MKKWVIGLVTGCLILWFPAVARADGVAPEFFLFFGCGVVLPLGLFLTLVEGAIISRYLKTKFWDTCRFTFVANLVSAIVGIPALSFNQWLFDKLMPQELHLYFKYYLPVSILIFLVYFGISVVFELLCGLVWKIRKKGAFTFGALFVAIVLANLVTYAVLAPIDYFAGYPKTNIRTYTPTTEWAQKPPVKIVYLDNTTQYLMQIDSDGRNKKVLVPFPVRGYLFSPDLSTFVFIGTDKKLYWYRMTTGKKVEVAQREALKSIMDADLSPSGNKVAYLSGKGGNFSLTLMDIVSGKKQENMNLIDAGDKRVSLAWSKDETILYLWEESDLNLQKNKGYHEKFTRVMITNDLLIKKESMNDDKLNFADNYGRFWFAPSDSYYNHDRIYDEFGNIRIQTRERYGMRHFLMIKRDGKPIITFSNRPGIFLPLYNGSDPSIIQMGKECLFELDDSQIYLIDIETKTVGKVTDGHSHVVPTASYTKKRFFENRKRYLDD